MIKVDFLAALQKSACSVAICLDGQVSPISSGNTDELLTQLGLSNRDDCRHKAKQEVQPRKPYSCIKGSSSIEDMKLFSQPPFLSSPPSKI